MLIELIYGYGTPFLFLLSGIYLTLCTGFVQFRRFPAAIRTIFHPESRDGLSPGKTLLLSLGAVMGPGNLIGVAAAVAYGGPGTVFWMWISGWVGMALRYAETTLSRLASRDKAQSNGMMDVMTGFLHFPDLALFFAGCGVLVSLFMANLTSAGVLAHSTTNNTVLSSALVMLLLSLGTLLVLSGGGKRIAAFSPWLVLGITLSYLGGSLFILLSAPGEAFSAIRQILTSALDFRPAVIGSTLGAFRHGIAKGIYSNECGIGSEPAIAGASSVESPQKQGEVSMLGPFLDTTVFCALSGVLCVMSGEKDPTRMLPVLFDRFCPGFGSVFIYGILALLVYATILCWYYGGEVFWRYLTGGRWIWGYRSVYCVLPLLAPLISLELLYNLCDLSVALMAFPSLAAILLSSPKLKGDADGSLRPR